MTTTNEPLSGVDLAVVVAEEVMGWKTYQDANQEEREYPCLVYIDRHPTREMPSFILFREKYHDGIWWEPWRDPRAYMDIVDKMREMGYEVAIHFGAETVSVFYNKPTGSYLGDELWDGEETAQTPGEAVMLAALQAVKKGGNDAIT